MSKKDSYGPPLGETSKPITTSGITKGITAA
ncbi:hypothetical protein A2U01_0113347, partial [Trifolium medium]|nr:hypothetical protein [Trifolium medium]